MYEVKFNQCLQSWELFYVDIEIIATVDIEIIDIVDIKIIAIVDIEIIAVVDIEIDVWSRSFVYLQINLILIRYPTVRGSRELWLGLPKMNIWAGTYTLL